LSRKVNTFHLVHVQSDNIDKLIQDLLTVNQIRWNSRGHAGITEIDLYTNWANELFNHNRLYLEVAYSKDRPIAAIMCVKNSESLMYVAGGFDIEFSKLSPGKVMILRAIEESCNHNLKTFDFLRGLESYKLKWGCTLVPTYRLILGNNGIKGKLASSVLEFESKRKDQRAMERFRT
jgi:CelD/BcsL family acetyltransferase involved in cellulose biosynthesis